MKPVCIGNNVDALVKSRFSDDFVKCSQEERLLEAALPDPVFVHKILSGSYLKD